MPHSEHFSEQELRCPCCGRNECTPELIGALEDLRFLVGQRPITVHSAYRCQAHNAAVGGTANSKHLAGIAADVSVAGVSARKLYDLAQSVPGAKGFGVSDTAQYLHFDLRQVVVKVRWCYDVHGHVEAWHEC